MIRRLLAALALILCAGACPGATATPVYGYRVVHAYPHDPQAYTEGLFFQDGALYESTGENGRSSVRQVRLETGQVLRRRDLDRAYFGEGIVAWKGRLMELTWRSHVGFIYRLNDFDPLGAFGYPGEGWGLTQDGRRLIMSDGSPTLRFLDPDTLQEIGRVRVTDHGRPVDQLNELEFVKGEVFANIWQTDRIARIDPATGNVTGWIDLSGLMRTAGVSRGQDNVLNGVAYDAARDRLFVTGKLWPRLFEIVLTPKPQPAAP